MSATVYVGTSLDGFIAREDDDIDWLVRFQNAEVHDSYAEFMQRIDAIVIGRGTFYKVLTFPTWPYEKQVFVLSTTLQDLPDNLKDRAVIVAMRPRPLLDHLVTQGYARIYVDGGKVIQDFLREDCIDELIVTKVPVLIG